MPGRKHGIKQPVDSETGSPINSFPEEILIQVFGLVSAAHQCPISVTSSTTEKPKPIADPVTILSHVCAYWRHIILNARELWTHIDLDPDELALKGTNGYLTRVGENLLDIHVANRFVNKGFEPPNANAYVDNWVEFLTKIAPRAWGVTVQVSGRDRRQELCCRAISIFFKSCVPGKLKLLSIEMLHNPPHIHHPEVPIEQPEELVETLWLPITMVRLRDFYPSWSSKLYHGLTELRLTGHTGSIPESALISILESSPKLRILQIAIKIINQAPEGPPIIPVLLEDLEVLVPGLATNVEFTSLLSLIQPGSKPLSLSVVIPWSYGSGTGFIGRNETKDFFTRSNVTRIVARGFRSYSQILDLLAIAPTVRALALEETRVTKIEDLKHPPVPLDALYVTRSTAYGRFTWPCVEEIVQMHQIKKLTFWHHEFCYQKADTTPVNLYHVCSSVNLLPDNDPDPVQTWK